MKANEDVQKGTSIFWTTSIEAMHGFFVKIWLTAVRDSKWVWRLDNFLGPRYTSKMFFQDYSEEDFKSDVKQKSWLGAEVARSHQIYRFFMGAVDQSDVKSRVINLTRETVSYWPQKMLFFLIEASIINAYGNYNLDTSTKTEGFSDWFDLFIQELLDISKNYRKYKNSSFVRKKVPDEDSPARGVTHKKMKLTVHRRGKNNPYGTPSLAALECPYRNKIYGALRHVPVAGTLGKLKPKKRRVRCAFCGRLKCEYQCIGCKQYYCMTPPVDLLIPDSNPPRKFRSDGLWCPYRDHGYRSWNDLLKN